MSASPSLLDPSADRLGPSIGLALVGHLALVAVLVATELLQPEEPKAPLIDPRDAIEVYSVMPKSAMAQRATRMAAPRAPDAAPATAEPAPPNVSEMAYEDEEATPTAGLDDARRKLAEELRMASLLDDLDADEGTADRDATSPEGVEGARATTTRGKPIGDPEYARYIDQLSRLFLENFRPIPVLAGKGLKTVVLVRVDADGHITDRQVAVSSGNPSWDRSALVAAESVKQLPLPPERYRDRMGEGYDIVFEDP